MINKLNGLFSIAFSENCKKIEKLPASGSNREYYRLFGNSKTVIAAYNPVKRENDAFIHFTEVFVSLGINVPSIYFYSPEHDVYFIEDLGDVTVYEFITGIRDNNKPQNEIIDVFKRIIDKLIVFQLDTYNYIDFNKAFPRPSFDKQSIMWDLNYFKYYFLKLLHINFDEQLLEDDFNTFADYLLTAENKYFMYRDFQSRNIMIKDNDLFFIDYQGGRKGPLQYDLASLLYSAKTDLPESMRALLLEYYIEKTKNLISINETNNFKSFYYAFVMVRILQALGAYGYRGLFEGKTYFINSIPLAVENLKTLLEKLDFSVKLPELMKSLNEICNTDKINKLINK